DWIIKWRDVRRKKIPATQSAYEGDYLMYISILRTLANTRRTDLEAHKEYLSLLYDQASTIAVSRDAWSQVATEAESSMRYFDPEKPPSLRRYRGIAGVALAMMGAEVSDADLDRAREDLEAAVKADPGDGEAANDLAVWHQVAAAKAKTDGKT